MRLRTYVRRNGLHAARFKLMSQDPDFSLIAGEGDDVRVKRVPLGFRVDLLLLHLDLSLLQLIDLTSDHFHFLELTRDYPWR